MSIAENRLVLEIDLQTEAGRMKFHQDKGPIFKACLLELIKTQQQQNSMNDYDKDQVSTMYRVMVIIATSTSPHDFREKISKRDIEMFMQHATNEIIKLISKRNYIETGALEKHDCVLTPLAALCYQIVPGEVAFQSEFFEVLAEFVKACNPNKNGRRLPSPENCRLVCEIVSSAYVASRQGFKTILPAEKAFKKLETSGMLQQFLRCLTAPESMENDPKNVNFMLGELQNCPSMLKKKFRRGEPCGDTLFDIVEGRDGSEVQLSDVVTYFNTLKDTVIAADPTRYIQRQVEICNNCRKGVPSEGSLMTCARCKLAQYCSKACQKEHWSHHKKFCKPVDKQGIKKIDFLEQAVTNFLHLYYVNVMLMTVTKCESSGLDMSEMVIELNFSSNGDNIVPAMQNPPIFKVVPARCYIEGSQREIPDWIRDHETPEIAEVKIQRNIEMVESLHTKSSPAIIAHYDGGVRSFYADEGTRITKDAKDAFLAAMHHQDFEPLSKILKPAELQCARTAIGPEFVVLNPEGKADNIRAMELLIPVSKNSMALQLVREKPSSEYLGIMHQEMSEWMKNPKCCCNKMNGDDQSIHNYLFYTGRFPNATSIPNRFGIVHTVGKQAAEIYKAHEKNLVRSRG
eukprot:CAMPEP_0113603508 /NCGR_PEP_ID=MMETSP0017_2-20120614/1315_1 /TAXON_ID=2856 /ORGANISM="Cylindrotheca closterium" /LENGTH=628 /DNA_ID=CAMNT_0000511903 /DNA_START=51 /DNA_END=1934 /DNA_ORIENTATION=+ /assembly_acc=CAM_ASM_000147